MLQLYKNIRNRRIELGMTQDDLAKMLGYSGKSAISRIEKGEINLPQSKLYAFANVLNMSLSDLSGFDSENLTPEDREALEIFHSLTPLEQRSALEVLKSYANLLKSKREGSNENENI